MLALKDCVSYAMNKAIRSFKGVRIEKPVVTLTTNAVTTVYINGGV